MVTAKARLVMARGHENGLRWAVASKSSHTRGRGNMALSKSGRTEEEMGFNKEMGCD